MINFRLLQCIIVALSISNQILYLLGSKLITRSKL